MKTGQKLSMSNTKSVVTHMKNFHSQMHPSGVRAVSFNACCRLLLAVGLLLGLMGSPGYGAEVPTLAEARAQASVWQNELNKAVRSGDTSAAATARQEIRNWEAIVAEREAEVKQAALLKEARSKADQADEIARLRGIKVPAHLKGEQRVLYILRQDQQLAEKEKTNKEKAAQNALKDRLTQFIMAGDYNATKSVVNQGAKPDIDAVQLAVDGGYTGIAYLLVKSNEQLPRADIERVLGKALVKAATQGDTTRIDNLMKLNADPNYADGKMTPMLAATRSGNLRIISSLIKYGARPDPQGLGKLLFQAVRKSDQNAAQTLLRLGAAADYAEEGASVFSSAIEAGNLGLATLLVKQGATPKPSVLGRALFRAIEQANPDHAKQLLKLGADVNYTMHGKAPLTAALDAENMNMANMLISAGGDDPSGKYGQKLFDAALEGDMVWVKVLARLKRYLNHRTQEGETPLHAAAARGHSEAVVVLLAAGADPNSVTVKNWSPVHHAARFGHKLALMHLLKGGADVYQVNSDGYDAYNLSAIAMKNSKYQLDNRGVLEYLRIWQQYHPRPES